MDPDPDPYWIRIGIQPKIMDPDIINADPQPWFQDLKSFIRINIWIVPCQHRSSTRWDRKRIAQLFDPDPDPQPISGWNPGPELIEPDTDVMI